MANNYVIKEYNGQMYYAPAPTNNQQQTGMVGMSYAQNLSNQRPNNALINQAIKDGTWKPVTNSSNNNPINPAANYIANPFTTSQLNTIPFQASPSMMQAYNAKMQRYGITPQPFVGSPQVDGSPAPVKGGK